MMAVRVLIADDHRLFAEALRAILSSDKRIDVVLRLLLAIALIGLIVRHSGRDTGFGGMGFTPASQGGTHIVERNLTRLTVLVAICFAVTTVALFHLL